MPPKGKKGRRAAPNKKKKGGRAKGGKPGGPSSHSSLLLREGVPNFDDCARKSAGRRRRSTPTLYSLYKATTRRFLEHVIDLDPRGGGGGDGDGDGDRVWNRRVECIADAVDRIAATYDSFDPSVLRDLRMCIRQRDRVARKAFGGGDKKHEFFLDTLRYCYSVLRRLPASDEQPAEGAPRDEDENYFAELGGYYDAADEDEEMFPTVVPRPEPADSPVTLEELVESDDRNDAILFLIALDDLMAGVAAQYRMLARNIQDYRARGIHESAVVDDLLQAATASNFAIQKVQQLEAELQAQHDHLTTPCRLLAAVALPEVTASVCNVLNEHNGAQARSCDQREVVCFVGDCLECFFLNPSDDWNRRDTIVGEFCSRHGIDARGAAELDQLHKGISALVVLEVPIQAERTMRSSMPAARLAPTHAWLQHMDYVGGDRAIHHTLRLLQLFAGVVASTPMDHKRHLNPRMAGAFGPSPWVAGRASKTRDIDELLMSTILPNWMVMCRHGIVGKVKLPGEAELCPLFVQMRSYVENPRRPVPWALAFGVHAMLTGILEVGSEFQGTVTASRSAFRQFFHQTTNAARMASKEGTSDMGKSAIWKHNLSMVAFLENFDVDKLEEQALWNPLCSGSILLMITYFGNLEGGTAMVDCQAQLRIVMYLYRGLLVNGIIHEGEIPMLDILYCAFKDCKALWQGEPPCRGELVKRFWICFGMDSKDAKEMAKEAQQRAMGVNHPAEIAAAGERFCRGRKLHPIEPGEIAKSFCRIREHDFRNVVDNYHTPEQKKSTRNSEQYHFAVNTNDTLDHIAEEIPLLSTNLISVAYYLEQFVCSLTRVLQWDARLKRSPAASEPALRQGVAILFAQEVLGSLDFSNERFDRDFLPASFIQIFFSRTPREKIFWFQTTEHTFAQAEIVGI